MDVGLPVLQRYGVGRDDVYCGVPLVEARVDKVPAMSALQAHAGVLRGLASHVLVVAAHLQAVHGDLPAGPAGPVPVPALRRAVPHPVPVAHQVFREAPCLRLGDGKGRPQDKPLDVLGARRHGHTAIVEVRRSPQRRPYLCRQIDCRTVRFPTRCQLQLLVARDGCREPHRFEELAGCAVTVPVHHAHYDALAEHVLCTVRLVEDHELSVEILAVDCVDARRYHVHLVGLEGDCPAPPSQVEMPEVTVHAGGPHVLANVHAVHVGALV
mmetsp:Transcript_58752/g.182510  ORF Transcript_58752/g.182510 Transcript_58752/m.182510 type:complete len:269 (+) Transcript_58752:1945-2751(+)